MDDTAPTQTRFVYEPTMFVAARDRTVGYLQRPVSTAQSTSVMLAGLREAVALGAELDTLITVTVFADDLCLALLELEQVRGGTGSTDDIWIEVRNGRSPGDSSIARWGAARGFCLAAHVDVLAGVLDLPFGYRVVTVPESQLRDTRSATWFADTAMRRGLLPVVEGVTDDDMLRSMLRIGFSIQRGPHFGTGVDLRNQTRLAVNVS